MSIPWSSIHSFLLRCGSMHTPLEFGKEVLLQINSLIPFDQGRFYILDCNGKIEYAFCLGVDPAVEAEYYHFYSNVDEVACSTIAAAARFAHRYPTVEECIRTAESYSDAESFFYEYIQPNCIAHSFGLGLRDTHHALRSMFSLDRLEDAPYTREEVEIMKIIRPHLDNLHQNFFVQLEDGTEVVPKGTPKIEILTRREKEIADLLIQGVTPKNIGKRLSISYTTVNKHLSNMHTKLQVDNRQELIVKLMKMP